MGIRNKGDGRDCIVWNFLVFYTHCGMRNGPVQYSDDGVTTW